MLLKNWQPPSINAYGKIPHVLPLPLEMAEEPDSAKSRSSVGDFQDRDCVNIYLHDIGKIPLLNPKEEIDLFRVICSEASDGSWEDGERVVQAGARVVEGNLRLVAKIAMRYRNLGLPLLDLIQEGNVGLMKAVKKFDPERGFRFTTYATWWIQQSMMRALTDHSRTIRLPAHVVERLGKLNRSREYLQQKNNRKPTMEEVAEEASIPVDKVRQTFELGQELASLDTPLDEDDRNSFIDIISDQSAQSPEDEISAQAVKECLDRALDTLSSREAEVLRLRFGLSDGTSYTLEQLGHILGVTRERVRQIEKKALMKLRHPKRSAELREFVQ